MHRFECKEAIQCVVAINFPDGTVNIGDHALALQVFWGKEGDDFDPMTQILKKTVQINVMMRGGDRLQLEEVIAMRQYTFQELSLLALVSGFDVAAAYSDYDMETSMLGKPRSEAKGVNKAVNKNLPKEDQDDDSDAFRMIVIFQKPLAAPGAEQESESVALE